MLKILFFGDIVGKPSREALIKNLPKFKKKYKPDFIIANGENLSHGYGINKKSLDQILKGGIDIVTGGNHIFDKKEVFELLQDKNIPLLRPLNYPKELPGKGFRIFEKNKKKILVINVLGRVFMKGEYDDPFRLIDLVLEKYTIKKNLKKDDKREAVDAIIVDCHAEATAEKYSLAHYLDGKISAFLGTHTHVQTADEQILIRGTAYIADIGMVGPIDSVIGIKKDLVIKRFLTQVRFRTEIPNKNPILINAVLVSVKKDGLSEYIKRIKKIVKK